MQGCNGPEQLSSPVMVTELVTSIPLLLGTNEDGAEEDGRAVYKKVATKVVIRFVPLDIHRIERPFD